MKRFQWLLPFLLLTTLACAQDQTATSAPVTSVSASPIQGPASQPAQNANPTKDLAGTSWKLVKLQTGDEETHVPDDPTKYTITFGANGRVNTRVDCNNGSSTWKVPRAGELQFGSWSRGTAKCGPGSLHDKIVTEGANPRSYSIKNGHLFLAGMAAGGFYELEPIKN